MVLPPWSGRSGSNRASRHVVDQEEDPGVSPVDKFKKSSSATQYSDVEYARDVESFMEGRDDDNNADVVETRIDGRREGSDERDASDMTSSKRSSKTRFFSRLPGRKKSKSGTKKQFVSTEDPMNFSTPGTQDDDDDDISDGKSAEFNVVIDEALNHMAHDLEVEVSLDLPSSFDDLLAVPSVKSMAAPVSPARHSQEMVLVGQCQGEESSILDSSFRRQIEEIFHGIRSQTARRTKLKLVVFSWIMKNGASLYFRRTLGRPLSERETTLDIGRITEKDILDMGLKLVKRRINEIYVTFKIRNGKQKAQFKKQLAAWLRKLAENMDDAKAGPGDNTQTAESPLEIRSALTMENRPTETEAISKEQLENDSLSSRPTHSEGEDSIETVYEERNADDEGFNVHTILSSIFSIGEGLAMPLSFMPVDRKNSNDDIDSDPRAVSTDFSEESIEVVGGPLAHAFAWLPGFFQPVRSNHSEEDDDMEDEMSKDEKGDEDFIDALVELFSQGSEKGEDPPAATERAAPSVANMKHLGVDPIGEKLDARSLSDDDENVDANSGLVAMMVETADGPQRLYLDPDTPFIPTPLLKSDLSTCIEESTTCETDTVASPKNLREGSTIFVDKATEETKKDTPESVEGNRYDSLEIVNEEVDPEQLAKSSSLSEPSAQNEGIELDFESQDLTGMSAFAKRWTKLRMEKMSSASGSRREEVGSHSHSSGSDESEDSVEEDDKYSKRRGQRHEKKSQKSKKSNNTPRSRRRSRSSSRFDRRKRDDDDDNDDDDVDYEDHGNDNSSKRNEANFSFFPSSPRKKSYKRR